MPGLVSLQVIHDFHISAAVLGMVSGVQFFMYMALQVPVGILGDLYGPELFLLLGALLDGAGTVVFSLAGNLALLFVARAMVGLGDALIWINLVLVLSQWFKPAEYLTTLGLASTAGNAGTLLTMIPVSIWLAHTNWRVPFTVAGLLLVLAGGAMKTVFRKAPGNTIGGKGSAGKYPPGRLADTLKGVLREKRIWPVFLAHFSVVGIYTGFLAAWAIPYLMITYQVPRTTASMLITVALAGSLLGGPAAAVAKRYWPSEEALYFGVNVLFVSSWLALYFLYPHPGGLLLYPALFTLGLSAGAAILAFSLVRRIFGLETNGLASGVVNTGGFLGAVSLPVLFGLVLDRFSPGKAVYTPYAFHAALAVCGLLSLIGLVGSGLLLKGGSSSREGSVSRAV
jgi:MFS family permease